MLPDRPTRPTRGRGRLRAAALLLSCLAVAGTAVLGRPGVPLSGAPDQAAADVLHAARQQVGDRYVWGASGPDAWDCSGLTSRSGPACRA